MTTPTPPIPPRATPKPTARISPAAPVRPFYPRIVQILAVINVVWIVLGIVSLSSGSYAVYLGYLVLPQAVLITGAPWLGALISASAVLVAVVFAAIRRRSPHGLPFEFFAAGTMFLTVALIAGPIMLLGAPLF